MRACRYRWFQVLTLLLVCSGAQAASGFRWRTYSYTQPSAVANKPYATGSAICDAVLAHVQATTPNYTYTLTSCQALDGSTGAPTAAGQSVTVRTNVHYCSVSNPNDCLNGYLYDTSGYSESFTNSCADAGATRSVHSSTLLASGSSGCDQTQCGYTIGSLLYSIDGTLNQAGGGQDIFVMAGTSTGQSCTTSNAIATASGAGDECFDLGGVQVCVDNTAGDMTVADTAPPATGTCAATADGGQLCKLDTAQTPTSPPVPNDGTSTSTPAEPNITINNISESTTTTYYNSTTVNNQASGSGSSSSSGTNTGTDGDGGSTDGQGTGTDCQGSGCTSSGTGGDWYTPKTDTFGTVLNGFITSVQSSAVFTQIGGFFTVNVGGSCPTWSVSVWVFDINIDQQCSSVMQNIWPYIAAIVIATAAWLAFRIAFL